MAVVQLPNQDLVIWPRIALEPTLKREVSAPAFPDTQLYAAPNLDTKRPDIRFSATLGNTPEPEWNKAIDQVIFETALTTEVILSNRESGIVLFMDLLQKLPKSWFRG